MTIKKIINNFSPFQQDSSFKNSIHASGFPPPARMTKGQRILSWLICFTAALFFFYEFIQMNMFNAIDMQIIHAFNLRATDLGKLSATYFYANIIFLFFAGSILDRFSTKKVILITLGICILGTFFFTLAHSFTVAAICRLFTGIGSAFCFLSCVRLASRWFPQTRLAFVIGLVVTMAMTGGIVAQTPLTLLVNAVGWRMALTVDAGLGLVIWLIILLVLKDYPAEYHEHYKDQQQRLRSTGILKCWRIAFLRLRNWLAGIYTCALNLPLNIIGGVWGVPYLTIVRHFTLTQASYVTSMLFFGAIIGSPVMGFWSDHIKKRKLPMIVGALVSLSVSMIIIYTPHLNLSWVMSLFLLLGFVTSTQVISYPTVAETNDPMLTATSVSIVSISVISGYGIFQPMFGWLIDQKWHGTMANHVPVYNPTDFSWAILIIPIGILVGLLAALAIRSK